MTKGVSKKYHPNFPTTEGWIWKMGDTCNYEIQETLDVAKIVFLKGIIIEFLKEKSIGWTVYAIAYQKFGFDFRKLL